MIKTAAGALLVIISLYAIGCRFGEKEKQSIELLMSLRRMLLMLSSEINYSGTPLTEVFSTLGGYENECWADYFRCVSEKMDSGIRGIACYRELGTIMKETLDDSEIRKYMKKEDVKEFVRFGNELSCNDKAGQLGRIGLYTERIGRRAEQLEKDVNERVKLYKLLGIAGGIIVTILIL